MRDAQKSSLAGWILPTALLILCVLLVSGCAPAPGPAPAPDISFADPDSPILKRARVWVENKVPYGSFDDIRENDLYNGYRADCSGFVSYAWALNPPGNNTTTLLTSQYARSIDISELSPGDAINNGRGGEDGHVVLFVRWLDEANHKFIAYDQNKHPGFASEKIYTLVPLLNSDNWTIKEIDRFAPGPYYAQHLISADDLPFAGIPPAPGLYPINRVISTQADWEITLDSIEVMRDGTMKVYYSWLNLSSQSDSMSGDDHVRIVIQMRDGSILEELDTNCGTGSTYEAAPNRTVSCWSTVGVLQDGTSPFNLIYVDVGQVDGIVLRK
jgi:hypothetical protein